MGSRDRKKKETLNVMAARTEVIAGVERFIGERARKAVVAKGRYVGVTYRKDDGKVETAEGFVRAMDETELAIRRDKGEKVIPRAWIEELMVCDNPFQLLHAQNLLRLGRPLKRTDDGWDPGVGTLGILGAIGGGVIGWVVGTDCESDGGGIPLCAPLYSFCGVFIGGGIGIGIAVLRQKSHGQFGVAMTGSAMGLGAGAIMTTAIDRKLWPSLLVGPIVAVAMMSKRSHQTLEPRRFSVGLAPAPDGSVSALATLRF